MVLLMNANFLALSVIPVQRALCLVLTGKAESIIQDENKVWRSVSLTVQEPKVIRLLKMVKVPYRMVPLTRRNVCLRDDHTCQYCKQRFSESKLTMDHVRPKSRGGETRWDNVVASCYPCNHSKGSRLLSECRMELLREPQRPSMYTLLGSIAKRYGLG